MKQSMTSLDEPTAFALAKLAGKPLSELGNILADRARYWRYKNQVAILKEARKWSEHNGVELSPVSLKTLFPLLDASSLEEDPDLQKLWARLLVNSGSKNCSQFAQNLAIELLKGISSQDALLIDSMIKITYIKYKEVKGSQYRYGGIFASSKEYKHNPFSSMREKEILEISELSKDQFEISVENILRYRILRESQIYNEDGVMMSGKLYSFTKLGWEVMGLLSDTVL